MQRPLRSIAQIDETPPPLRRTATLFPLSAAIAALVALLVLSSGCASSHDPMRRIFEAPNVIHVCVRPPNVADDKQTWALTSGGAPFFEARMVDLARRAGSPVYVFDPDAPPESTRLLPIPYNKLECPARVPPPKAEIVAAAAKAQAVDEANEAPKAKDDAAKAERPKALPRPIVRSPERCPEPGQARRRGSSTGARTCTRTLVYTSDRSRQARVRRVEEPPAPPPRVHAEEAPEPVRLSARAAQEYEDWGLTPADVSTLAEDRGRECLERICHARHQNFIRKGKKATGARDGQALSSGGEAPSTTSGGATTVKTTTRHVSKPKPNGTTAGHASPAANGDANAATTGKRVPNPNGRNGGKAHQDKVREVAEDIEKRGLEPGTEDRVKTPGGHKENRYMDVVGKRGTEVVERHQVGKQTKDGRPVARERRALDDVERSTGQRPTFHPYNRTK